MQKNHGFTLVELLIVVAIIGILAAILAPKLMGSMDSAKEQQCRNNLKQLHNAVLHFAADYDMPPFAQTFEYTGQGFYEESTGWVSWIPKAGLDSSQLHYGRDNPRFGAQGSSLASKYCDDLGIGDESAFAIREGKLYDYVGSMDAYRCPVTAVERNRRLYMDSEDIAEKSPVYRSYAMNYFFGASCYRIKWARDMRYLTQIGVSQQCDVGNPAYHMGSNVDLFSNIPQASRLLLFTEVLPSPSGTRSVNRTGESDPARSPYDCAVSPKKFNDVDLKVKEVGWAGRGTIRLGIPRSEMLYGLHEPLIHYVPSDCYLGSALAVFFDGHVEKVFPVLETSDGEASANINSAWFLTHGLRPAEKIPGT